MREGIIEIKLVVIGARNGRKDGSILPISGAREWCAAGLANIRYTGCHEDVDYDHEDGSDDVFGQRAAYERQSHPCQLD